MIAYSKLVVVVSVLVTLFA